MRRMLTFATTASAWEPTPDQLAFHEAVGGMIRAMNAVQTASFDLHQQEWVNGALGAPVVMHVKYRAPNDVLVQWENGQKVLWLPGRNEDRMYVDPGPLLPNLSLSPENALARRGQRHTIRRLGLQPVADLFSADHQRIVADPERLAPDGITTRTETVYGKAARCWTAEMHQDREPALYAARVDVCLDDRSLPLRLTMWAVEDGAMRQIEQYGYADLTVGPLPADTFDPSANGF